VVGVPHGRDALLVTVTEGVTDHVLVLHRHDRDADPGEPAHVTGRRSGRVHHDLGGDPPRREAHRAYAPAGDLDACDGRPGQERDAQRPGAFGQGAGQGFRAQEAVAGQPARREHVARHRASAAVAVSAGVSSAIVRPYVVAALTWRLQLLDPLGRGRQPQPADARHPGRGRSASRSSA
jgi:hypothetical protein